RGGEVRCRRDARRRFGDEARRRRDEARRRGDGRPRSGHEARRPGGGAQVLVSTVLTELPRSVTARPARRAARRTTSKTPALVLGQRALVALLERGRLRNLGAAVDLEERVALRSRVARVRTALVARRVRFVPRRVVVAREALRGADVVARLRRRRA